MEYNDILECLKNLECEKVECKENFREEDFGKTMAAFSTKDGGKIFLGINKNLDPVGVIWNQNLKDKITQVARTCEPPASITIEQTKHDSEKHIICIKVNKGNGSIYTYRKIPYERKEGINHPLSPDETLEIQKRGKKIYFDEMQAKSVDRPGLISDIDEDKVKRFLIQYKGGFSSDFNLKLFLTNSELSVNGSGKVKNAAILLFGKNPSQFIPQNKINISIFPTNEITNEFIKTEIIGTIEDIYKRAFVKVMRNIKTYSFVRGSERIEVSEYPPEAIREIIVNALVHRDYFLDNSEIFIKVFKDRIEVINPGGFPLAGYSWEEIESSGLSIRRNPKIAEFLEKIKFMEKGGHGIRRIKNAMKDHGLSEPKIETTANTFKITLFGIGDKDAKSIALSPYRMVMDSSQLNGRQLNILNYIKSHPTCTRNECCAALNIPVRTMARDLKHLINNNFIISLGKGRGTYYQVR